MITKKITYTDYNGVERTEEFMFNMSKAELMEKEMSVNGGLSELMKKVAETQDAPQLIKIFKDLVLDAYGVKSNDGKRFIKSEELRTEFSQTEAYSVLFMELAFDADAAAKFINGIIPADMAKQLEASGALNK